MTPKKCKLLILSFDVKKLSHLQNDESITIDSISASMVKDVLCAGDFAFLLRDNIITNNVAFPNKFLEYISSGMKIITTPYVYDIASMVEEYQLGRVIKNINDCPIDLIEYIDIGYKYGEDFGERTELLSSVSFKKVLKPFVNDIQNVFWYFKVI